MERTLDVTRRILSSSLFFLGLLEEKNYSSDGFLGSGRKRWATSSNAKQARHTDTHNGLRAARQTSSCLLCLLDLLHLWLFWAAGLEGREKTSPEKKKNRKNEA